MGHTIIEYYYEGAWRQVSAPMPEEQAARLIDQEIAAWPERAALLRVRPEEEDRSWERFMSTTRA